MPIDVEKVDVMEMVSDSVTEVVLPTDTVIVVSDTTESCVLVTTMIVLSVVTSVDDCVRLNTIVVVTDVVNVLNVVLVCVVGRVRVVVARIVITRVRVEREVVRLTTVCRLMDGVLTVWTELNWRVRDWKMVVVMVVVVREIITVLSVSVVKTVLVANDVDRFVCRMSTVRVCVLTKVCVHSCVLVAVSRMVTVVLASGQQPTQGQALSIEAASWACTAPQRTNAAASTLRMSRSMAHATSEWSRITGTGRIALATGRFTLRL